MPSGDIEEFNRKDIIVVEIGSNREHAVLRKTNSHYRSQVHAADRIDRTGDPRENRRSRGCL